MFKMYFKAFICEIIFFGTILHANSVKVLGRSASNLDFFQLTETGVKQSSKMGISVQAGTTASSSSARAYGRNVHIITDQERRTFRIEDRALKEAVRKYHGRSPNDAFVRSPTPWGDLYNRYKWQQVTTTIVPIKATVLSIETNPIIVKRQTFKNTSSKKGTFEVTISDTVSNSISSSWSTSGSFSVSQTVEYGIEFLGTGVSGSNTVSFELGWGEGGSKTQEITIGSVSGVSVELGPGESVEGRLTASRGTMKVRVQYRAYLSGLAACNYNPRHKGHHFWAYSINGVMDAGGITRTIDIYDDVSVGYYSDSSILLADGPGSSSNWIRFTRGGKRIITTSWFSEEHGGYSGTKTAPISGIRCAGGYCDRKQLQVIRAGNSAPVLASGHWTRWFSEERPNYARCPVNQIVNGIQCKGGYCDNMRLSCGTLTSNYRVDTRDIKYTGSFSEEHGFRACNDGYYLWGISCRGGYCDNIQLHCARVDYIP